MGEPLSVRAAGVGAGGDPNAEPRTGAAGVIENGDRSVEVSGDFGAWSAEGGDQGVSSFEFEGSHMCVPSEGVGTGLCTPTSPHRLSKGRARDL